MSWNILQHFVDVRLIAIYPVETLKTQMMSSTGESKRTLIEASRRLWAMGGLRAYYRGLIVSACLAFIAHLIIG